MNNRNKFQHDDENNYPKIAGNMIVKVRSAEQGYMLRCACRSDFQYIPASVNSVTVKDNILDPGSPRAMCPNCNTLWNEKLNFEQRPAQIFMAIYMTTNTFSDCLVTLGFGFDKIAIINKFLVDIENTGLEYSSVRFQDITKEKFDQERKNLVEQAAKTLDKGFDKLFDGLFDHLFRGSNG